MTVYEMIQELAKYPPDAEIQFWCEMVIDGHAGESQKESNGSGYWVGDFEFDDLLTVDKVDANEMYIEGTGDRECPIIKLRY